MKKSNVLNLVCISLAIVMAGLHLCKVPVSANVVPGTASDPVVSKSYVDAKFNQLLDSLSALSTGQGTAEVVIPAVGLSEQEKNDIIEDVVAQIEFKYRDVLSQPDNSSTIQQPEPVVPEQVVTEAKFIPVYATFGQIVVGHEGTEIILRSGSCVGYCPGDNGLVNLSNGSEVVNDTRVPINNLIIVPRHDGRGLYVTTNSWFIIKGGYDIMGG